MAKVKIDDIVHHLDREFRNALDDTLKNYFPKQSYNIGEIYRYFERRVHNRCSTWESVPESCIEK